MHPRRIEGQLATGGGLPLVTPVALTIGLDLAKERDYTAWAVVETVLVPTGRLATYREDPLRAAFRLTGSRTPRTFQGPELKVEHWVRNLDRRRGDPYPAILKRTAEIVQQAHALVHTDMPPSRHPRAPWGPQVPFPIIALDATGVGGPVVDMFRASRIRADIAAIIITSGDVATRDDDRFRVPKRDLVSALMVALEGNQVTWAKTLPGRSQLEQELRDFSVQVTASGHDRYGAIDGNERHDDLVMALALAVWHAAHASSAVVST
jgi:hypothetical protein